MEISPSLAAYRLGRRLVRSRLLGGLIPGRVRALVQSRLAGRVMDRLPDRQYLEQAILPALATLGPIKILDVGVQSYSEHLGAGLASGSERWTIDSDPAAAQFGEPGRHLVASFLDIEPPIDAASFDAILMNGVFGHGIDRLDEQESAVAIAQRLLRRGGWLLVGWNRDDEGRPIVVKGIGTFEPIRDPLELDAVRQDFDHVAPGSLPARKGFADSSHVFDWFRAR